MTSFSERDEQSDCKLAVTRIEFGYNIFKQIKFSSFIVVMFVLLSVIEALPGGTFVPVPLFFLNIELSPCFMFYLFPCSLTILFPSIWHFLFP